MHCTDPVQSKARLGTALWASLGIVAILAGCKSTPLPPAPMPAPPTQTASPAPAPAPVRPSGNAVAPKSVPPGPASLLPAPTGAVGSWAAYRLRAAHRVIQANPANSFVGPLPEPLASIPVLQIRLNADGSVREIDVLRTPKFFPETVEKAKLAVMRAAPFGPVGNLPQPWQFNETFLYNDDLKFQLDTLIAAANR